MDFGSRAVKADSKPSQAAFFESYDCVAGEQWRRTRRQRNTHAAIVRVLHQLKNIRAF
jgi:hypothetical protein